jgi:hypothetical protein
MIETPINEGAEVTAMLTGAISAPLICIKAFLLLHAWDDADAFERFRP